MTRKQLKDSVALSNVLHERQRQDRKWGEQNHKPSTWLMILGEEVGEANKAAIESMINGKFQEDLVMKYRDEMVQVAAVALAAVEAFDRGKWK